MATNVRATNWPSRGDAAGNMPAKSRKGEHKASRRTYDARMLKATERKLDALMENAQRFAARVRCNDALAVVDASRDALTRVVADAATAKRIASHPTREHIDETTVIVVDGDNVRRDAMRRAVVKVMVKNR